MMNRKLEEFIDWSLMLLTFFLLVIVWLLVIAGVSTFVFVALANASPCEKKEFHWNVYRSGPALKPPPIFADDVKLITDWMLAFPELKPDLSTVNGGIPQLAKVSETKAVLVSYQQFLGAQDFNGWIVLDFEKHFPQWERIEQRYKDASIAYARLMHPKMLQKNVEALAKSQWESASLKYWLEVIKIVRELRPKAKVAYFDLMQRSYWLSYLDPVAGAELRRVNNKVNALHRASDGVLVDIYQFYPSGTVPLAPGEMRYEDNQRYVEGNIKEGLRLGKLAKKPVYAYAWHRYHDSAAPAFAFKFVRSQDMALQLTYPLTLGANGSFLWGNELQQYDNALGNMQPFIDTTLSETINNYCGGK